jgi:hypothetical protein
LKYGTTDMTAKREQKGRLTDLSRANNDRSNLLAGTGVGTVFVGPPLRIARFTPAATQGIIAGGGNGRLCARAAGLLPDRF